jgi:hypothetical protein
MRDAITVWRRSRRHVREEGGMGGGLDRGGGGGGGGVGEGRGGLRISKEDSKLTFILLSPAAHLLLIP